MPVSIRNTDILFNDGTTQGTAAGAPTTTQVLNATASASVGAVGTYAFLINPINGSNYAVSAGSTSAGSTLRYAGNNSNGESGRQFTYSAAPAGTWRAMGYPTITDAGCQIYFYSSATLWLRIS